MILLEVKVAVDVKSGVYLRNYHQVTHNTLPGLCNLALKHA